MSDFYKQSYRKRMESAGDLSEGKFAEYADRQGLNYVKYGFDSGVPELYKAPGFITSTPDFLVIGKTAQLVEVKGCGEGDIIRIKATSIKWAGEWNKILPVTFFLFDHSLDTYSIVWYNTIVSAAEGSPSELFPNSRRKFYKVQKTNFKWSKMKYE